MPVILTRPEELEQWLEARRPKRGREDNRRLSNGEQYLMAANAALALPVSRQWKGYSQRAF
jgi:hypothetical protein